MQVFGLLFVAGFSAVLAQDQLWMELMSAQIVNAAGKNVETDKTIPQLAEDLGLKTLVELVTKAKLARTLASKGPFTVFGPTDKAFSDLPEKFVDFLLKNITVLGDILKYHVLNGKVLSKDLKNDELVPSLQGKDVRINIYKNGTVITASGRRVKLADQEASNGVIHEVSGVMFPPPGTITAVIKVCPAFKTLLKAVSVVPAIGTVLDGEGPYTLFAPSEEAFAKIPAKCLAKLLSNTELLTKVLKYHVVKGAAYSAGLSCGDRVKTLEGGEVKVTIFRGHVRINRALVTYPDGSTTNGVIHVINRLLWPRDEDDFCDGALSNSDNNDLTKEKTDVNIFQAMFAN